MRSRTEEWDPQAQPPSRSGLPELHREGRSLPPDQALDLALAEDRRQRDARRTRSLRRARAAWRANSSLGWLIPIALGVAGAVGGPRLMYVIGPEPWQIAVFFGVTAGMLGGAAWFCVGDWLGRKLLGSFLLALRREGIGFDVSETGTSRES